MLDFTTLIIDGIEWKKTFQTDLDSIIMSDFIPV